MIQNALEDEWMFMMLTVDVVAGFKSGSEMFNGRLRVSG